MTIIKKVNEVITGETEAICPICKQKYKYPKGGYAGIYIPPTCGKFECEYKFQHPELSKARR